LPLISYKSLNVNNLPPEIARSPKFDVIVTKNQTISQAQDLFDGILQRTGTPAARERLPAALGIVEKRQLPETTVKKLAKWYNFQQFYSIAET
jgi:hypothetical protein